MEYANLCQSSTLYLKDVPLRVTWVHVQDALQSCGKATQGVVVRDDTGSHTTCTWKVSASNAGEAEMMLAALDGMTVVVENFIWVLRVFLSLQPIKHLPNTLPIFVPRKIVLSSPTRMVRYREMRQYGRLVSVLVNVDMGFSTRGDVLHFWEETGANAALAMLQNVLDSPQPKIFDPENVHCAGFDSHVDLAFIRKHFAQYGAIARCQLKRADGNKSHVYVRFQSKEAALKAVLSSHEGVLGSNAVVRFHELSSARLSQADEVSGHTPDAGTGTHKSATVETAQQGNQKGSDSSRSPNGIGITEDLDLNEEMHLPTTCSAEETLCAEKESSREAQHTFAFQSTPFHKEAIRLKHDRNERPGPAKDPQLASKTSKHISDREKYQALQRDRDPHRKVALQRCEATTFSRTSAQSTLAESHARELEIQTRRLAAARTVAQTTVLFEEALRLREAAERRETAATLAHQEAARVLVGVKAEAEGGRRCTCDALSQLHAALEKEYEAQLDFLPFDGLEDSGQIDQASKPLPPFRSETESASFKMDPPQDAEASTVSSKMDSLDGERLADSIRKVEEMRRQEERESQARKATAQEKEQMQAEERARTEAAAKLRQAEEEHEQAMREAKEREELERAAREQEIREREKRARIAREKVAQAAELEDQQRIRRKAHNNEIQRCRLRDRRFCANQSSFWSPWLALQRFQATCEGFDTITFSEQQPLAFESVPWPVLHRPDSQTVSTIDWSAVEAFFHQVRIQLQLPAYKDLVEKTHRRFHPDRWSSRGILAAVFDGDSREKIREAGNVVSQTITPIWRESRSL